MMEILVKQFEKYISFMMMLVAMLFVCYQVIDLVIHFTMHIINGIQNQTFNIEEKGRPVAGVFFSILLTMEIIQTIRVFAHAQDVKVKIILIVGIIAVTRKILMLDNGDINPMEEIAIAALILALSAGYYLVSKSDKLSKID